MQVEEFKLVVYLLWKWLFKNSHEKFFVSIKKINDC